MIKYSFLAGAWPKIYQKLKSPPPGVNLGDFSSKLPPMNKIVLDPGVHSDNPQAIGYVTTEDSDNNGVIDTIHISSPKLEQQLTGMGLSNQDLSKIDQLSKEQLISILTPFVELISHEMGHVNDFRPEMENPFPGGEGVADAAARSAVEKISVSNNTNIKMFGKTGRENMNVKTLKILADLAGKLDSRGATKLADQVEKVMIKISQEAPTAFREDPRAGMQVGMSDSDATIRKTLDGMREGMRGEIRPDGDPYTYKHDKVNNSFIVATTPPGKESILGRVIEPGSPGHDTLMVEVSRGTRGVKHPTQKFHGDEADGDTVLPTEKPLGLKELEALIFHKTKILGLRPPISHSELLATVPAHLAGFRDAAKSFADQVVASLEGSVKAIARKQLSPMNSPSLDAAMAYRAWNEARNSMASSNALSVVEIKELDDLFHTTLLPAWNDTVEPRKELLDLIGKRDQMLAGARNKADDHSSEHDHSSEDGDSREERMSKMASLKDEYSRIFAMDKKSPFNRSGEKYRG